MFNFHIITNVGSLVYNQYVRDYPNTLCLAQLYKNAHYQAILKDKIRRGHRVILDNGAHEGIDFDIQEYAEIVMDLKPSVVVLTDLVGRDCLDSRNNSLRLLDLLDLKHLPNTQFMYVSQGKNKSQVLEDYAWALCNLEPERYVIGLGQGYLHWAETEFAINMEATRLPMIQSVMNMPHRHKFDFHVLGARWSSDGTDYSWWPEIKGIDTIKPVTCAFFNKTYPHRPAERSVDRESMTCIDQKKLINNIRAFCNEYHAQWWRGSQEDISGAT